MNARDPKLPLQADEASALADFATRAWDERIVPALTEYIAIPAKSPMFDADWAQHGHLDRVVRDAAAWVEGRKVPGLKLEVVRLPGRTPVIFFELAASGSAATDTVLLYGHLDKQPEFSGWRKDLGPWTPKIDDGRLYGRGGADDGYAVYAAITAIESLQAQGLPHPRCVGLVETCEESGSGDLPAYIEALRPRLGQVGLVVCLDSGAGNYDQLWLTTSLRGMASGVLKVEILTEGVHSGDASGLVPSSFRILRQVLDRLEDSEDRPPAAGQFPLRGAGLAHRAGARHRRDPAGRGLEALPLGLRRRRRPHAADHHRPAGRAARPHLAAHALGHRGRRLPGAGQRRQRAAPAHRVQAQPAPAAAGRCARGLAEAEGAARRQRALQRQGHLPPRRPRRRVGRHRLECAGSWHPGSSRR
jgi:hypothetical protein